MMQWGIQRSLSKTDFGNNYQKKKKKPPLLKESAYLFWELGLIALMKSATHKFNF